MKRHSSIPDPGVLAKTPVQEAKNLPKSADPRKKQQNVQYYREKCQPSVKFKIICFALLTRLAALLLQAAFNLLIPDHDAKVFISPGYNISVQSHPVVKLLSGFMRWDAQYFYHIAKFGYTYENTLAFAPLFPVACGHLARHFSFLTDQDAALMAAFFTFNTVVFSMSSIALYDLTRLIIGSDAAYRAAILFCINPATVFFVAPYSEALFSLLSFYAMLSCTKYYLILHYNRVENYRGFRTVSTVISIGLSMITRSNGLLNIGFLVYVMVHNYIQKPASKKIRLLKFANRLAMNSFYCLLPFICVQIKFYEFFCTTFKTDLPDFLVEYGQANGYVLMGTFDANNQSWCHKTLPYSYNYVQDTYWNVGFMKYYQIKQLPNFLLALPILWLVLTKSADYLRRNVRDALTLGLLTRRNYSFVFVVHAAFLAIFCIFFVHIQVTTRMLCSSSPVVYWFASEAFQDIKEGDGLLDWFIFKKTTNSAQRFIKWYFLTYFVCGLLIFCNFLPWT